VAQYRTPHWYTRVLLHGTRIAAVSGPPCAHACVHASVDVLNLCCSCASSVTADPAGRGIAELSDGVDDLVHATGAPILYQRCIGSFTRLSWFLEADHQCNRLFVFALVDLCEHVSGAVHLAAVSLHMGSASTPA